MIKRFLLSNRVFIRYYDFLIVVLFQIRSIRFKSAQPAKLKELNKVGLKILLLAPHYDDEILGAFCLLHKEHERQDIDLAYITDGKNCHTSPFYQHIEEVRRKESAMALKGIHFSNKTFLSFPDGSLHKFSLELEEWLEQHIIKHRYNILLAPAPDDRTPDHHVLSLSCLKITEHYPEVDLFFYRSTWSTFPICSADLIYSSPLKKKYNALRQFSSQNNIPLINTLIYSLWETKSSQVTEGFIHRDNYFRLRPQFEIRNMLKQLICGYSR
jgi:LmbE family N-acetylglucosaminyl deacetylase